MNDNNKVTQFIVDEELHNLLITLRNTKEAYRRICVKMRREGVALGSHNEIDYNKDVDELICTASCIICEQLCHEIEKGGLV